MKEIQTIVNQTPIEIVLGIGEDGMTTARKLYEFLELARGQFSRWAKTNITENPFAEPGIDYERFDIDVEGNKTVDYRLSANFAKKLSMQGKTERAEQARDYFIRVEDKLKEAVKAGIPHNVKVLTITSRDICKIIGRVPQYHGVILREIRGCIKELEEMGFNRTEFFIDSTYLGGGGGKEIQPQFLVTDRGCEYFSGRLEPEERRVFLIECTDRFERLQNVLDGKPFKPVRKAIEQGETVLELYRNNKWGILAMDGDLYNLTPEELEMVYDLVPKLNKGGVTQILTVIAAMLEGSERGGKLERIGGYHCTGGSASSSAENAPKNQKAGNSHREEPVDLDKVIVLTKEQAKVRYNISFGNLRKVADDIGAIRHMGIEFVIQESI